MKLFVYLAKLFPSICKFDLCTIFFVFLLKKSNILLIQYKCNFLQIRCCISCCLCLDLPCDCIAPYILYKLLVFHHMGRVSVCLMPSHQFVSYITMRASYFLIMIEDPIVTFISLLTNF